MAASGSNAGATSLLAYLQTQNQLALDRLYADRYTCQAILRALHPLCRQYVIQLVGAHGELPVEIVRAWPAQSAEAKRKHEEALRQLDDLRLLSRHSNGSTFRLHHAFSEQLLKSICGAHDITAGADAGVGADKHAPTVLQLERHAQSTWEGVLQCVVTPPPLPVLLAVCQGQASLQDLLHGLGLVEPTAAGVAHVGTATTTRWTSSRAARHYLLTPSHTQVWQLMLAYMELAERTTIGARDATLAFLLRLGSLAVGCDCSVETLDPMQKEV